MELFSLVKDTAVEICSISCCVFQGPGTPGYHGNEYSATDGSSLRATFERISQFSVLLLAFKVKEEEKAD